MSTSPELHRRWLLAGCICGLGANVLYIVISVLLEAAAPPVRIVYPLAWAFGPLVVVTGLAIHAFLTERGPSILADIGRWLMTVAGGLVAAAITLRGVAEDRILPARPDDAVFAARWADDPVQNAVMLVQRGVELAWESFIFLAVAIFAAGIWQRGLGGRIVGGIGAAVAVAGLIVNAIAWPADPDAARLPAMGPFAGFWFMAVAVMMGVQYRRLSRDAS